MGIGWSSSCLISGGSSANRQHIIPLLLRIPGVTFGMLPPAADAGGKQDSGKFKGAGSGDSLLQDLLVKLQRQPPHAEGNKHKLAIITPFRDGCTAMSQVPLSLSLSQMSQVPIYPYTQPPPLSFSLSLSLSPLFLSLSLVA